MSHNLIIDMNGRSSSNRKRVDILGIQVDAVSMKEAVGRVEDFLQDGKKHQIATPNPEQIILAQKDEEFKSILSRADLVIPDGIGLLTAAKFLSLPLHSQNFLVKFFEILVQGLLVGFWAIFNRKKLDVLPAQVTGADLMLKLCEQACQKGWSVFLLGGEKGVTNQAAHQLKQSFPGLKIVGVSSANPSSDLPGLAEALPRAGRPPTSDFLFVAYGAPTQERWIAQNLPRLPIKVAMGVGGGIDFIAGRQKRAPRVVRKLGLEWLWRLLTNPFRLKRIFNAVVIFPWLVLKCKLAKYRSNL